MSTRSLTALLCGAVLTTACLGFSALQTQAFAFQEEESLPEAPPPEPTDSDSAATKPPKANNPVTADAPLFREPQPSTPPPPIPNVEIESVRPAGAPARPTPRARTPELSPGPPPVDPDAESDSINGDPITRAFMLKHIIAADAVHIIQELHRSDAGGMDVIAVPRNNMLLYRGPGGSRIESVEALLRILDVPASPPEPGNDPNNVAPGGISGANQRMQGNAVLQLKGRLADVRNLLSQSSHYTQAEHDAARQAEQYRNLAAGEKVPAQALQQARERVKASVAAAFTARQRLQKAELDRFEARLRSLRESLERREQLKLRIIQRRVEDLISSEVMTWLTGNGFGAAAPPSSIGNPGTPARPSVRAPGNPARVAGPAFTNLGNGIGVPVDPKDFALPVFGRTPEQVFLVGITSEKPDASGKKPRLVAWLLDRGENRKGLVVVGSAFQVGNHVASVASIDTKSVTVRRNGVTTRWELGKSLAGEETLTEGFPTNLKTTVIPVPGPQKTADAESQEVEAVGFKSIRAEDALDDVRAVVGPGTQVSSDPLNNVLIIRGKRKDVEAVRSLIDVLEKQKTNPPDRNAPGTTIPAPTGNAAGRALPSNLLKSPSDYLETLQNARQNVDQAKILLKSMQTRVDAGQASQKVLDDHKQALADQEQRLALAIKAYQTQMRLLELDVQEARSDVDAQAARYEMLAKLSKNNAVSKSELQKQKSALRTAEIRLERARAIQELYQQAEAIRQDDPPEKEVPGDPVGN